jgi:hypothetical protein
MNMAEALSIIKSLTDLEQIAEAMTTGDGRWQTLQDWLAANPKWKREVESWVSLTPDQAFDSLRDYTAKRAKLEPIILDTLIDAGMKFRVKKSIQTLQALYRERKEVKA